MARFGYKLDIGVPGSGQAQVFRNWLAANLTTWTVGPVYVKDSGSLERDYFTLTSNFDGEEILVVMPNGSSMGMNDSLDTTYIFTSDESTGTNHTMGFMFGRDGGFEARLVAGDDPKTDTGTFYPNRLTQLGPIDFWSASTSPCTFYVLEDDSRAAFHFYLGFTSSNQGYEYWGYDAGMKSFSHVPNDPTFIFDTRSVLQISVTQSTSSTPRPISKVWVWDHYTGQTERFIETTEASGLITSNFLNLIDPSTQPGPDNSYLTSRTSVMYSGDHIDYLGYIGQFNSEILRETTDLQAAGYRKKFQSGGGGEVFVHVYEYLLTPWAGNLDPPV